MAVATAIGLLLLAIWTVIGGLILRKWQYHLFSLMLTVLVTAIACGWLGREVELTRKQTVLIKRTKDFSYAGPATRLTARESLGVY
jgi:hypothetical protein